MSYRASVLENSTASGHAFEAEIVQTVGALSTVMLVSSFESYLEITVGVDGEPWHLEVIVVDRD